MVGGLMVKTILDDAMKIEVKNPEKVVSFERSSTIIVPDVSHFNIIFDTAEIRKWGIETLFHIDLQDFDEVYLNEKKVYPRLRRNNE